MVNRFVFPGIHSTRGFKYCTSTQEQGFLCMTRRLSLKPEDMMLDPCSSLVLMSIAIKCESFLNELCIVCEVVSFTRTERGSCQVQICCQISSPHPVIIRILHSLTSSSLNFSNSVIPSLSIRAVLVSSISMFHNSRMLKRDPCKDILCEFFGVE